MISVEDVVNYGRHKEEVITATTDNHDAACLDAIWNFVTAKYDGTEKATHLVTVVLLDGRATTFLSNSCPCVDDGSVILHAGPAVGFHASASLYTHKKYLPVITYIPNPAAFKYSISISNSPTASTEICKRIEKWYNTATKI